MMCLVLCHRVVKDPQDPQGTVEIQDFPDPQVQVVLLAKMEMMERKENRDPVDSRALL